MGKFYSFFQFCFFVFVHTPSIKIWFRLRKISKTSAQIRLCSTSKSSRYHTTKMAAITVKLAHWIARQDVKRRSNTTTNSSASAACRTRDARYRSRMIRSIQYSCRLRKGRNRWKNYTELCLWRSWMIWPVRTFQGICSKSNSLKWSLRRIPSKFCSIMRSSAEWSPCQSCLPRSTR